MQSPLLTLFLQTWWPITFMAVKASSRCCGRRFVCRQTQQALCPLCSLAPGCTGIVRMKWRAKSWVESPAAERRPDAYRAVGLKYSYVVIYGHSWKLFKRMMKSTCVNSCVVKEKKLWSYQPAVDQNENWGKTKLTKLDSYRGRIEDGKECSEQLKRSSKKL